MARRTPTVIPGADQTLSMQTLGPEGVLLNVTVTLHWREVQRLARRAHANKTRRSTDGPVTVKAVRS